MEMLGSTHTGLRRSSPRVRFNATAADKSRAGTRATVPCNGNKRHCWLMIVCEVYNAENRGTAEQRSYLAVSTRARVLVRRARVRRGLSLPRAVGPRVFAKEKGTRAYPRPARYLCSRNAARYRRAATDCLSRLGEREGESRAFIAVSKAAKKRFSVDKRPRWRAMRRTLRVVRRVYEINAAHFRSETGKQRNACETDTLLTPRSVIKSGTGGQGQRKLVPRKLTRGLNFHSDACVWKLGFYGLQDFSGRRMHLYFTEYEMLYYRLLLDVR